MATWTVVRATGLQKVLPSSQVHLIYFHHKILLHSCVLPLLFFSNLFEERAIKIAPTIFVNYIILSYFSPCVTLSFNSANFPLFHLDVVPTKYPVILCIVSIFSLWHTGHSFKLASAFSNPQSKHLVLV